MQWRYGCLSAVLFLITVTGTGCSSNTDPTDNSDGMTSGNTSGGNDSGSTDGGGIDPQPADIQFWRESDSQLSLFLFDADSSVTNRLSEIVEIDRLQMSAEALQYLEAINDLNDIYSPESVWPEFAFGYGYPDCPDVISGGTTSTTEFVYIARSSGSTGEPILIASNSLCGDITMFSKSDVDGVIDPGWLKELTRLIRP